MHRPSLLALALLSACVPPDGTPGDKDTEPDDTDTRPDDTDTDTLPDDTDTGPPDTGPDDTGPGDTDTADAAAHAWTATFDAPDLRVRACGTDDAGWQTVAPGPDLDGDGLAELAIGTPGLDGPWRNSGGVYVFAGSDVVDGARTWDTPTRILPVTDPGDGFGHQVRWVGDRDGDGFDDLLVGSPFGDWWSVSGADLLAGGDVAPHALVASGDVTFTRWADVDGDGRDDWLFAFQNEGPTGASTGQGALSLVLDVDFTLDGLVRGATAYGTEIRSHAGTNLAALHEDQDGDGIPELALSMYDDLHVIGSAAFLAGEDRLADAARTSVPYMYGHQVLAPGDLDGDGLDELVVFDAGNKVCVIDGADTDGSEKVCLRDGDLGPNPGAALGEDLDNDGIPDLWVTRGGYLVALDVGALAQGIDLALAQVAPALPVAALAVGEGEVWGSAYVSTDGSETDVAAAYTASLTPRRQLTLRGGRWGGNPMMPIWRDVSGDGVVDLVVPDTSRDDVAVFDGTTLAGGGDLTWCDATWSAERNGVAVTWIDDVDGDGADDALVETEQEDGSRLMEVWPGPVASGIAEGEPLATWTTEVDLYPLEGCDLDGDGREELAARASTGTVVYGGALGAEGFVELGAVTRTDSLWCMPDVDGDGRDELYTLASGTYRLYHACQLDPAVTLTADDAWLSFPSTELRYPEPLHDPHGSGGLVGWWLDLGSDYQLCVLDLAGLSGALATADIAMTCAPELYGTPYTLGWLDAAVGDAAPDVMLYGRPLDGELGLYVLDGSVLGSSELLVPGGEDAPSQAGIGSDVLGVGAHAVWGRADDPDLVDRYRLDIVYARAVE